MDHVADRFRELERPESGRVKDTVLMATVTSFESLRRPRPSDLHLFAELFEPLFLAASDEARRQAAAALSRCPNVPDRVARQIASAPIAIAAIFLTRAAAISDRVLLSVIRSRSAAHAAAIARREDLSVAVVDALVERRQTSAEIEPSTDAKRLPSRLAETPAEIAAILPARPRSTPPATEAAAPSPIASRSATEAPRSAAPRPAPNLAGDEALRRELKALVRAPGVERAVKPKLDAVAPTTSAVLVRFARLGEVNMLVHALAAALDCPPSLGERLVLDSSGQQLALALAALRIPRQDAIVILAALYPGLNETRLAATRCATLLAAIDPQDARTRLTEWIAAEMRAVPPVHRPFEGPARPNDPRSPTHRPLGDMLQPRRLVQRKVR